MSLELHCACTLRLRARVYTRFAMTPFRLCRYFSRSEPPAYATPYFVTLSMHTFCSRRPVVVITLPRYCHALTFTFFFFFFRFTAVLFRYFRFDVPGAQ